MNRKLSQKGQFEPLESLLYGLTETITCDISAN